MMENYFTELNSVDVSSKTERKNGLTFLSWAWAWGELKKRFPDATYTVYKNEQGWIYHTDGRTCWVETGVTVGGIEHIENLPVMDCRNRPIPAESVTSVDVNKAIQRSLTKAVARHGLGLYIYAGEDLPESEGAGNTVSSAQKSQPDLICRDCGGNISDTVKKDGELWPKEEVAEYSIRRFNRPLCPECQRAAFNAEKAKRAETP